MTHFAKWCATRKGNANGEQTSIEPEESERERGADFVVASKTVTKNNENFYMSTTQSFNVFLLQVWWIFPQTWAHGDEASGPVICIDRL